MRKFKPRACKACREVYQPTGPAARWCSPCGEFRRDVLTWCSHRRRTFQRGGRVGVGSGGQNKGSAGEATTATYRAVFLDRLYDLQNGQCWGCAEHYSKELLLVHHVDHNRRNNVVENLELVCKRCHQIEHRCWEAFSKGATTIERG